MKAQAFVNVLKRRGVTFFAGVPDSTFQTVFQVLAEDPAVRYVPAVREDVALGVASAAYFAGHLGGVMMQNSGLGNIVNPLTSFSLLYRVPVLLVVGWRGYGGAPNDAPEHWVMGAKTRDALNLLEVPSEVAEPDGVEAALDRLLGTIRERSVPGALLVRHGVIA
jgi:sulfopyruvate decarboxylase TPP-binding subunit